MVRLQGLDGSSTWCDAKELAGNCSCLLLHHCPAATPFTKLLRRGDGGRVPQDHVIRVSSREPITLLCSLVMGPQYGVPPPETKQMKRVVVICGPTGAGRVTLARRLLGDFPNKLAAAPRLTNRKPHPKELRMLMTSDPPMQPNVDGAVGEAAVASHTSDTNVLSSADMHEGATAINDDSSLLHRTSAGAGAAVAAGPAALNAGAAAATGPSTATPAVGMPPPIGSAAPGSEFLKFLTDREMALMQQARGWAEHDVWGLEAAWAQGKVAVVVGSLAVAEGLKQLPGVEVSCGGVSEGHGLALICM